MRHIMDTIASIFRLIVHGRPDDETYHRDFAAARARQERAENELRNTMEALTSPKGHSK